MGKLKQFGLVMSGLVAGVLISLQLSAVANRDNPSPLPVEEMRALATVFEAIKQNYVDPVDDKKLVKNALSGMVTGLDPHSAFLDEEDKKDLQVSMSGVFGGLGIEVGMEDGFVKVVSPIEDTPAFRAGLKAGDLIIRLDTDSVKGMSLSDAVKRMRGKPGTKILLTVMRKGQPAPFEVSLTREEIKVQSVKSKMIEPGYGYLRITQFQRNTTTDLVRHLDRLTKQGPMKGLVLDLRNDPGGLLNNAVGVSAAFLPKDVMVVYTDGRQPESRHEMFARFEHYRGESPEDPLKNLPAEAKKVPMVVLVNGGSASASEIVAGALQDHKRATVMGTTTFGKASVQSVIELPGGTAVKLTTARYYTPKGRSIQARGIEPDLVVEENANASVPRLREADLLGHLRGKDEGSAPAAKPATGAPERAPTNEALRPDEPPFEMAGKGDFQYEQALNHLKGLPVQNKPPVVAAASVPAAAPAADKK